jgi:quercetin dioxygenase-like cupin family protein
MQETYQSHRAAVWMMLLGFICAFQVSVSRAEDHRFVRPEQATTYIDPASKSELKVLIDEKLGGTSDLTLAHIVIPPGVDVPDHIHQSTEIFYILSGELEQTSEGKVQKLTAGMACLVPANTTTHHTVTSKEPVHALVIWAPGGEEKRITERWQARQPTAKK